MKMQEAWFRLDLDDDAVFTMDAATEGEHLGLDYIPGSALFGHAVARLMRGGKAFDPELFFSGKFRFSDGFPLVQGNIAWPMPLSYHDEKGCEGASTVSAAATPLPTTKRWEQRRRGFLTADGGVFEPDLDRRLKTAIDRTSGGRSSDGQFFGYQSIPAGSSFAVRVRAEQATGLSPLDLIGGSARLGRSRSAEYARVSIRPCDAPPTLPDPILCGQTVSFLLVADLALPSSGSPRMCPDLSDFAQPKGVTGKLVAECTFMKFRRYSQWNAFHRCFVGERQVICRGSVITFELDRTPSLDFLKEWQGSLSGGIGLHLQDGLGLALLNAPFVLDAPQLTLLSSSSATTKAQIELPRPELADFLEGEHRKRVLAVEVQKAAGAWAAEWRAIERRLAKEGKKHPSKHQWAELGANVAGWKPGQGRLDTFVEGYCTASLRRECWNAKPTVRSGKSLLESIKNGLKPENPVPKEVPAEMSEAWRSLSLIEAARTMRRKSGEEAAR